MAGNGRTKRNHQAIGKLALQLFCQDGTYFELSPYCRHGHFVVGTYQLQLLFGLQYM